MVKVIAHAGCEGTAAGSEENIEKALCLHADGVEVDLRLWNGEVYLSHNPLDPLHLSQYVTFRRAVAMIATSEVEINCDLKEAETLEPAMVILREAGLADHAIFTGEVTSQLVVPPFRFLKNSDQFEFAKEGKKLFAQEVQKLTDIYLKRTSDTFAGYNIEYQSLTQESMEALRKNRVPYCCWTPDEEQAIRTLMESGADFITTNALAVALQVRDELAR